LMNPGKLIDPPPMTSHLRYQQEGYAENTRKTETGALFQFRDQGGLTLAVEQCNGVGACRNLGVGVMCPSYMATRDEKDTTRARANALRLAISGQLFDGDPDQAMASDEMHEVMKLCLGCKACKSECPNAVDMAKMKAEVLQKRYDIHGTPLGAKIIGLLPVIAHWMTGPWAPLINGVQGSRPMRWMLHQLCHIDCQRPLPRFTRRSLKTQLKQKTMGQGERGEVALYVDSYTNAYEPHVGQAAMKLLAECGFKVTAIFPGDSQRARISKGLVRAARRGGEKLMRQLDAWASRGIPIVCLEPSCASALKDDLPDLLADEELGRRVSAQVTMVDEFLWKQKVAVRCTVDQAVVHGHCHQKALFGVKSLQELLPDTQWIDAGCCGMAGAFGYEHRELSLRIGEDRLFPAVRARAKGAEVIACGFSCRHQIYDACGVMPKHFVEVVKPVDY
jgi:Fe-S oxidoreductase